MKPEDLLMKIYPSGVPVQHADRWPVIRVAAIRLCYAMDGVDDKAQTRDEIRRLAAEGKSVKEIQKITGVNWRSVRGFLINSDKNVAKRSSMVENVQPVQPEVNQEVDSEATSEAMLHGAARQEDTKQLQDSYEASIFPRNFEDAPSERRAKIESAPKSPEPGRNKYNRWEEPVSNEVDAEIARMDREGKNCREISGELAKKNIFMTFQRVRGRIALMAKKANKSPNAEDNPPMVQSIQNGPEKARAKESTCIASKPEISPELGEKIKKLDASGLSSTGISDQLYEGDGTVLSAGEISCYLYDIARGLQK